MKSLMSNKYRIIIFDLDGTLVDSLDDIHTAVNFSLENYGYPVRTKDEVRTFVGNGIRNLIERAVPTDISSEDIDNVFTTFKEYYNEHAVDKTYPYEGMMEFLEKLNAHGFKVGISTNKVQAAVDSVYNKYFKDVCDIALGDSPARKRKPSSDSVDEIVKFYGGNLKEVLYIGDSEVDIETAKNSNVDVVSVTWGFRSKEELMDAGADIVIDSITELERYILDCDVNKEN